MVAVEMQLLILVIGGMFGSAFAAISVCPRYIAWSGTFVLMFLAVKTNHGFLQGIFIILIVFMGLSLAFLIARHLVGGGSSA